MVKRILAGLLAAAALGVGSLAAAQPTRLSIGTGGTGGVYYPMGGGMAAILSKYVPGWEATAEVTGASVANLQLIGQGKQDFGFTMADTAWDAVSMPPAVSTCQPARSGDRVSASPMSNRPPRRWNSPR